MRDRAGQVAKSVELVRIEPGARTVAGRRLGRAEPPLGVESRHDIGDRRGEVDLGRRPRARASDVLVTHDTDELTSDIQRCVEHGADAARDQVPGRELARQRIGDRVLGGDHAALEQRCEVRRRLDARELVPHLVHAAAAVEKLAAQRVIADQEPDPDALDAECGRADPRGKLEHAAFASGFVHRQSCEQ